MSGDLINPRKGAISVLQDLEAQVSKSLKDEEEMLIRHKKEHNDHVAKRSLMEDTIKSLRKIYPNVEEVDKEEQQKKLEYSPVEAGIGKGSNTVEELKQQEVDSKIEADKLEDINIEKEDKFKDIEDNLVEEANEVEVEEQQGELNVEELKQKVRKRGTLRDLVLRAVKSMDNFTTLDEVVSYLNTYHKEEGLTSKDIRTSLKDSRRAKRLVGIQVVQKENGSHTFLNGLPEFFENVEQKAIKPEYQDKFLEKLIELNMETLEESNA